MPESERKGLKRKRSSAHTATSKANPNAKKPIQTESHVDYDREVQTLESQILQSQEHLNNLELLLKYARAPTDCRKTQHAAWVSLCRVFARLFATGRVLSATRGGGSLIGKWLSQKYLEYVDLLSGVVRTGEEGEATFALGLLMQNLKEEVENSKAGNEITWVDGTFTTTVRALIVTESGDKLRHTFVRKYVVPYGDIRYYMFRVLSLYPANEDHSSLEGRISLLSSTECKPNEGEQMDCFATQPTKAMRRASSTFKKEAAEAWMAILQSKVTKHQRKSILSLMLHRIAPWFTRVELLMDFLTDSFDMGGSTSLIALSSLFSLIKEKNLDYPNFYTKLYSQLDNNLLHSKHRSRFLRLLDTFLASTHLPAALVAGFIKRLSRLCLHAPPAGVVSIVPFIYNLLKRHPMCTFMLHRKTPLPRDHQHDSAVGVTDDSFVLEETDPTKSKAIESSLWEIETLQSHYHPNVASLARIISEQFTKQSYHMEDFLDHTYGSMLEADLSKRLKKPPVVEYQIPKTIFTNEAGMPSSSIHALPRSWRFD